MADEMNKDVMDENMENKFEEAVAEEVETEETETSTEAETEANEEETEESAESAETAKKEKEGFFKKKKDKKDEQIEELNDRVKRQMAEFDNFRKRSEKEKSQMFDMGAKTIIEKILPIVDNFERGLAAVPDEQRDDPFVDGMDKIYKQMMTELDSIGVKPIESVG